MARTYFSVVQPLVVESAVKRHAIGIRPRFGVIGGQLGAPDLGVILAFERTWEPDLGC